jgi:predicted GNAT family acetyltransferase
MPTRDETSSTQVHHDVNARRFVAGLEEGEAELAYRRPEDATIELMHTHVPRQARGEGVGEALVRAALAYAREEGLRVIPTCRYVAQWLAEHPEERDIVAR